MSTIHDGWMEIFYIKSSEFSNPILVNLATTNGSSHFNQRSRYSNSIMNQPCCHGGNQNAFQYSTRSHEFSGYGRLNFHGNFSQSRRGQHDKSSCGGSNKPVGERVMQSCSGTIDLINPSLDPHNLKGIILKGTQLTFHNSPLESLLHPHKLATPEISQDTNWYPNFEATNHLISNLNNLMTKT